MNTEIQDQRKSPFQNDWKPNSRLFFSAPEKRRLARETRQARPCAKLYTAYSEASLGTCWDFKELLKEKPGQNRTHQHKVITIITQVLKELIIE